jgi:hypothetical protein
MQRTKECNWCAELVDGSANNFGKLSAGLVSCLNLSSTQYMGDEVVFNLFRFVDA